MWSTAWQQLIVELHDKSRPAVLVVTGGGASAIAELLSVPGASRTILDARVPYAPAALVEWLGRKPDHFCDERTALAMASVACDRARKLAAASTEPLHEPLGVSCTASLASDRPKRGDHRCFIAVQTPAVTTSVSLTLQKDARSRTEEEAVVGQFIVRTLAETIGLIHLPAIDVLPGDQVQRTSEQANPLLSSVWRGEADCVWSLPEGILAAQPPQRSVGVLCGAFDPLHGGHEQLRAVAEKRLGGSVAYELSITNVDKPPLDFLTINRRRQQFTQQPLALTNAPRYSQKSAIFPHTTFVVGSDTAVRIIDAKYYGGDDAALESALDTIRKNGCRFLVASRDVDGTLLRLDDLPIPPSARDLFEAIPEADFRVDISSTELRNERLS